MSILLSSFGDVGLLSSYMTFMLFLGVERQCTSKCWRPEKEDILVGGEFLEEMTKKEKEKEKKRKGRRLQNRGGWQHLRCCCPASKCNNIALVGLLTDFELSSWADSVFNVMQYRLSIAKSAARSVLHDQDEKYFP